MLRRRVPIAVAVVLLILGVAAGKAWAVLDTAGTAAPAPSVAPSRTPGPTMTLDPSAGPVGAVDPSLEEAPTTTTTAPSLESQVYPSVAYWAVIHECEQRDSWTIEGVFGNGLRGGGGLGISDGAWWENGGREFAELPGGAAPVEQMLVAGRILQRYGPGAWGCKAGF